MEESKKPTFKLYSLTQITAATFLGGPLLTGILLRKNYKNLGKQDRGKMALIIGIVAEILVIILVFALPENIITKSPSFLIPLVYTGITYFLVKNIQGEEIEEHKDNKGEFYSGWPVVGISLIFAVIPVALIFGFPYLSDLYKKISFDLSEKRAVAIYEKKIAAIKNRPQKETIFGSPIQDQDGNTYKTVIIGTQTWMAENLRTTKYNDGKTIPLVTDYTAWAELKTPAYCWYYNDSTSIKESCGALYNWYAVNTGKLCPLGWHVPNNDEITTFVIYLEEDAGRIIEKEFDYWEKPLETGNADYADDEYYITNETGFSARGSGYWHHDESEPRGIRYHALWWSSSEVQATDSSSFDRNMSFYFQVARGNGNHIYRSMFEDRRSGLSVRCIKD
jgi:uncharacterized protein (TIGR02145 family)